MILNISSDVVSKDYSGQAIYLANKCGVAGITKSIANENQSDGILAALIHLGAMDTEIATHARPDIDRSLLIRPEDIADTVLYMLGLSDYAWADEITIRRMSRQTVLTINKILRIITNS